MRSEDELIQLLANLLHQPSPCVEAGIGDDAAVIRVGSQRLLLTTDALVEGVHFRVEDAGLYRVGRKSLNVNLSDIAAMAGRPVAAVVAVSWGGGRPVTEIETVYHGLRDAANQFGCPVVGGDTNVAPGPLTVAVTVLGIAEPPAPVYRGGARPGDVLCVTGCLGGSLKQKHLDFTPRLHEARYLAEKAQVHALMDISDGLALDAHRMAKASGVRLVIEAARVPISSDVLPFGDRLQHALEDGEDFELLAAVPKTQIDQLLTTWPFDTPLTPIGWVEQGEGVELQREDGRREPLQPAGYDHLR